MRSVDIAVIGVCAALYAVVGRLTDLSITVGGVAFYPAVFIPAVFAVLFGPWTGGIGGAIGIFIRDMLFHGDALLSLSAGVTSNFVLFFVIGYVYRSSLGWKKLSFSLIVASIIIASGLLLPTILLPAQSVIFTQLSTSASLILFAVTILVSLISIGIVSFFLREWRNFVVGAVIGQGLGAGIIALVVWGYSQLFFSSAGYFKAPVPYEFIPILFVWTFATEIPFILLLSPPIVKVCYSAFPFLRVQRKAKESEK